LTSWIEPTFGIEKEGVGRYVRRTPITLIEEATKLSEVTSVPLEKCKEILHERFIQGSKLKSNAGSPFLSFKLHQSISQGRTIYVTAETPEKRAVSLTLEPQLFVPGSDSKKMLFPLRFCSHCGQEYYKVTMDPASSRFLPASEDFSASDNAGYLMLSNDDELIEWDEDTIPQEWKDKKGV
jgi:hypothetical protein